MKYRQTERQQQILKSSLQTSQLAYLQRNSYRKVQQVIVKGQTFYQSISDQRQLIRLLVFSLLVKLHTSFSAFNQTCIEKLKQVIYSSKFTPQFTTHKGIQPNQLHKIFAQNITQIKIQQNPQQAICKLINCQPFFEEIIITACLENLKQMNQTEKNSLQQQLCRQWFYAKLGIKIIFTNKSIAVQKQDQLFINKEKQFLRQALQQEQRDKVDDMSLHSHFSDKPNPDKIFESIALTETNKSKLGRIALCQKSGSVNKREIQINIVEQKKPKKSCFFDFLCCSSD